MLIVVILRQREHKRCVGQWKPCKRETERISEGDREMGSKAAYSRESGRGLWMHVSYAHSAIIIFSPRTFGIVKLLSSAAQSVTAFDLLAIHRS